MGWQAIPLATGIATAIVGAVQQVTVLYPSTYVAAAALLPGFAAAAIGVAFLIRGRRSGRADARNRFGLATITYLMIIGAQVIGSAVQVLIPQYAPAFRLSVPGVGTERVVELIAPALLILAVLRQRLAPLDFAVNRTLVYGVVSAVLPAAFGLIEWAVDHFVPIAWREKNALVDAAIAVGIFLAFHCVRDGSST